MPGSAVRRLALVMGDQLSFDLAALQALDTATDAVLLAEPNLPERRFPPHCPQRYPQLAWISARLLQRRLRV